MNRSIFIFALITVLAIGCSNNSEEQNKTESAPGVDVSAVKNVGEVQSVEGSNDQGINFSWKDVDGSTKTFDSFRGKVTVVNFWATWCVPCKKEIPDLIDLSAQLADRGVKIIGVSTDRGPNVMDDVRSFVAEKKIPYQVVVSNEELENAFGNVRMIPTTFILDQQGKIVETIIGARSKEVFAQSITAHLQ